MRVCRFLLKVILFPVFLFVFTLSLFVKAFVNMTGAVVGLAFFLGVVILIYNIVTHCVFGICMTFIAGMMLAGVMLAMGFGEYLLDSVLTIYWEI